MPETRHSSSARLPVQTIWAFVRDMDRWAPLLTGYQSHEKESDSDSLWTLKGDVGVLARTIRFRAHVTEWDEPQRVTFTLTGLNEAMEGDGEFLLAPYEDETAAVAVAAEPARGWLGRLVDAIARFLFRRRFGAVQRDATSANAGPGAGMSRLTFRLRVDPGGPMAPMISAMMKPAMKLAVEDLSEKIVAHLESEQASGARASG